VRSTLLLSGPHISACCPDSRLSRNFVRSAAGPLCFGSSFGASAFWAAWPALVSVCRRIRCLVAMICLWGSLSDRRQVLKPLHRLLQDPARRTGPLGVISAEGPRRRLKQQGHSGYPFGVPVNWNRHSILILILSSNQRGLSPKYSRTTPPQHCNRHDPRYSRILFNSIMCTQTQSTRLPSRPRTREPASGQCGAYICLPHGDGTSKFHRHGLT